MWEFWFWGTMLFGLGALTVELIHDDDDDPAPADPDGGSTDPQTGFVHIIQSGQHLTAGDGPDTISASDDTLVSDVRVDAGGGDDVIRLSGSDISIFGGAGDDTMTLGGSFPEVRGGDGDDQFALTVSASAIHGDGGNDHFIAEWDRSPSDGHVEVLGGEGNNIFDISMTLSNSPEFQSAGLTGGPGTDTYNLTLESRYEASLAGSRIGGLSIEGFEPGQDVLNIAFTPGFEFDYQGLRLVEVNNPAETYTQIIFDQDFYSMDHDRMVNMPAIITLYGTTGMTADDINLTVNTTIPLAA